MLAADKSKGCKYHTFFHPDSPIFSFLQAEGSLGTTVVVILVDVEDLLVRARQSSSRAESVRRVHQLQVLR
jgi:hypothetical protein